MFAFYVIHGFFILLFAGLGILFALGKGQNLIAGYNTLSEEDRKGYHEKKLLRAMCAGMFFFSACMALSLVGALVEKGFLLALGYVLLILGALFLVLYSNTGAKK